MAEDHRIIPVWFFVGVLLLIYGVLILATGIYGFFHPPSTVLAELHPALWWGALLTIIGAVYVHLFRPRKS
jgi:divalent metal cation (Fe/Co/Zn/Cd) transporter